MIFSGVMGRTVCGPEVDESDFFLVYVELVVLVDFIVGNELGHGNSSDFKMSSQGFQLEGILVTEVELLLVFFMNNHQGDAFDVFLVESQLDSIE